MRIVVTVGGSILIKDHDHKRFKDYAEVLKDLKDEHEIFVVVGGGVTARNYIKMARNLGVSEAFCDDIGIEVTRLNAKLLVGALGDDAYPSVARNFSEALQFSKSKKVILMGGTEPAHSTDAVGAILAEFVGADLLVNTTSVDGLYNKDPKKYKDAVMFDEVTPKEMMDLFGMREIKAGTYEFFDIAALQIIKRSRIKTIIVNGEDPKNLHKAIKEKIGTVIVSEEEKEKLIGKVKDAIKKLNLSYEHKNHSLVVEGKPVGCFVRKNVGTASLKHNFKCLIAKSFKKSALELAKQNGILTITYDNLEKMRCLK